MTLKTENIRNLAQAIVAIKESKQGMAMLDQMIHVYPVSAHKR